MTSGAKCFSHVLSLSLYTYNCQTIKDGSPEDPSQSDLDYLSRSHLSHLIESHKFNAIALQEVRTPIKTLIIPGHKTITSGCDNNNGRNLGVELWLTDSESVPVIDPISGDDFFACFDFDQLVIIFRDPGTLLVSVGIVREFEGNRDNKKNLKRT